MITARRQFSIGVPLARHTRARFETTTMVVTIAWTHSWIAVSVSLGVLLLLLLLLLGCLCYQREQQQHVASQQYYMLDENGMKRMACTEPPKVVDCPGGGFFRRLSNAGVLRTHFRFAAGAINAKKHQHHQHLVHNERDLLDSLDFDKQFTNSVLQLVSEKKHLDTGDDWRSCKSEGSHFSGGPNRRNSTESMRSVFSEPGHSSKS